MLQLTKTKKSLNWNFSLFSRELSENRNEHKLDFSVVIVSVRVGKSCCYAARCAAWKKRMKIANWQADECRNIGWAWRRVKIKLHFYYTITRKIAKALPGSFDTSFISCFMFACGGANFIFMSFFSAAAGALHTLLNLFGAGMLEINLWCCCRMFTCVTSTGALNLPL